MKFCSVNWM